MNHETMSVHEAMAAIKMLDKRLDTLAQGTYVFTNKHSNTKINGLPKEEIVKQIAATHDSAVDTIARRRAIKAALSKSNASTMVVIGGKQYTVAEAIEMKRSYSTYMLSYIANWQNQMVVAKRQCDKTNAELEKRADEYVVGLIGSKEKVNSDDAMPLRQAYINANTMEVVTDERIAEYVQKLQEELDTFEAEVDAKLSISNAITMIEVEY